MTAARIAFTGDIHAGLTRFNPPGDARNRLRDDYALVDAFADLAMRERCDLAVVTGDNFDTRNPSQEVQAVLARMVAGLRDAGVPGVILDGNHDGRWRIADPSSATLLWARTLEEPGVEVRLVPTVSRAGPVMLATIPYPHKRAYDPVRPDLPMAERHELASRALGEYVKQMHAQAAEKAAWVAGQPVVFAGHVSAVGSVVGSERAMRLEDDLLLGPDALDLFDAALLGHIHLAQCVGRKARYAGAPSYVDFGEAGQPKSFTVATVEAGRDPVWSEHPTGARPAVVLSDPDEPFPEGANVRLVVALPRGDRGAKASLSRALYARGANFADVRLAPVEQPAAASDRALPEDVEPAAAMAAWLGRKGLPEEPYLGEARSLISGH